MKTLIKNGMVITMDDKRSNKYEKLDILIENDLIVDISEEYTGEYDKLIDASNKIVMPGLINSHTHLGMSLFRATNDNLDFNDWWKEKVLPIEKQFTDDDVYKTSLLSCIEMIKTGTTTANDMYFNKDGIIKAVKEAKVRTIFPLYFVGEYNADEFAKAKTFYLDNGNSELITFSMAPHTLYTCSEELIKESKQFADKYDMPIHIHFCEHKPEVQMITEKYNKKPMEVLKDLNLLDNKLILAHCTFITDEELEMIKDKPNISFVHNPVSNMNLGCGIADIVKYQKYGINVALGTDGQGSGNNMNLFYHMGLVDYLQKGKYESPDVMKSYDVLKMVTINGAKALGLEDKVGSIEVNKKADIIILDLNNIENYPYVDLLVDVVHNVESRNVDTTIINGEILMENKEILLDIDIDKLRNDINDILNRTKEIDVLI